MSRTADEGNIGRRFWTEISEGEGNFSTSRTADEGNIGRRFRKEKELTRRGQDGCEPVDRCDVVMTRVMTE